MTGLMLMIVGFALSWIPYINSLGGLLLLIGVLFVFLGRDAFDSRHRKYVLWGGFLLLLSVLITFFSALSFASLILGSATTPGATPSDVGMAFQAAFTGFVPWIAVAAILSGLATVLIPYAIADTKARVLLWGSFFIGVVISAIQFGVLIPAMNSAVQQVTSVPPGATPDLAPLYAVRDETVWLGLLRILPSAVIVLAYLRVRANAEDLEVEPSNSF